MQQPPLYTPPIPENNLRSGIVFGPGRSTRMPEKGTREYLELVERMRVLSGQNQ